jgi:hypothetical protein
MLRVDRSADDSVLTFVMLGLPALPYAVDPPSGERAGSGPPP